MKIAILGVGPIGSTFALHLARAGHEVTAIARGQRLAQLQGAQAIVAINGQRAAVRVAPALDPAVAFDLVLVTVLASQVDAVLPALRASAAKAVMFMFNTFDSLEPLREAGGPERFAFGFPAILASLKEGELKSSVVAVGQTTLTTDAAWARVFTEAGIPTVVEPDVESWLRTHAAMVVPVAGVALLAHARGAGVSWADARRHALALREGFDLVRRLGYTLTPPAMAAMAQAPTAALTATLWALSRVKTVQELGAVGPGEPRSLLDAMVAAAPDHSAALRAIRP